MEVSSKQSSGEASEQQQFWELVPLSDFKLPSEPVLQSARGRLDYLYDLVRLRPPSDEKPVKTEDELGRLDPSAAEFIAPDPDPEAPASALMDMVSELQRKRSAKAPVVLILGPPYAGHRNILEAFGVLSHARRLDPPGARKILEQESRWLERLRASSSLWVYPELERTFFRHPSGLSLVRGFLNEAISGLFGPGVIGCDSWAWEFINRCWHGNMGNVFVYQAMDAGRTGLLLRELSQRHASGTVRFRQSDNGNDILASKDSEKGFEQKNSYLQLLAAKSRGNAGVSRELWKASMQVEPEQNTHDEQDGRKPGERTIWIKPLDKLSLPSVSSSEGIETSLVLHALLLHNGLELELLQKFLPLAAGSVAGMVFRFAEEGLLEEHDGRWRVTASGYISVRQHIRSRGLLVDQC